MKTEQLRQSVKTKWLAYYYENRHWLTRLAIWINYKGQRRPASSFILASLAVLEPQLPQLLPLMVELSNDPDRIVQALGLNFNPDTELENLSETEKAALLTGAEVKLLPSGDPPLSLVTPQAAAKVDEACRGTRHQE